MCCLSISVIVCEILCVLMCKWRVSLGSDGKEDGVK